MTTEIRPPAAHQKPSGGMWLGTDQLNLVHGVATLVELDSLRTGFADGIENLATHRITPGVAGFYSITAQVTFLNLIADKTYQAIIRINGATYLCTNSNHAAITEPLSVPASVLVKLTATDYIELMARSWSGDNTVDVHKNYYFTFLLVQRIR